MMITAHGGALHTGRNSRLYMDYIDVYAADAIEVDIQKRKDLLYISHLPAPFSYKKKITLREVFSIVKEKKIKVNCDLKKRGILKDVIKLAHEYGIEDYLIFTGSVREDDFKYLDCGQVWLNSLKNLPFNRLNIPAIKAKLDSYNNEHIVGLNCNYRFVTKEFVIECAAVGISISMFTVDTVSALVKWVPIVNGNITTNQPNTAIYLRDKNKG